MTRTCGGGGVVVVVVVGGVVISSRIATVIFPLKMDTSHLTM